VPQLEWALGNVVSNAIKYSPDGGEIVVEMGCERKARGAAADETTMAVLSIRDRGVGIPEADLAAIFEPFHRATNVAGCLPDLGLGLTNAQQIVAQHSGSIRIASELGQGTSVTIHLPLFPADCVCDSGNTSALGQVR
jgi:signal transduction histidine kinase